MNRMTAAQRDVQEAHGEFLARRSAWLRSLTRCSCRRPVPDRTYLGCQQCRACGLLLARSAEPIQGRGVGPAHADGTASGGLGDIVATRE